MKLSALLVSVTIPVAASTATATAAYASDEATPGNSAWLKSSLASLDTTGKSKKQTSSRSRKGAYSQPIAIASGGLRAGPAQKLRPFVPNRRLPSEHDLDMQLIRQTAQMSAGQPVLTAQTPTMAVAPGPLTGNVAEVYTPMSSYSGVASYGSVGYVKQGSSRVMPGQVPAVQNQIRQFRSGKRTRYISPQSRSHSAASAEDMQQEMETAALQDNDMAQQAPMQFAPSLGYMQQPFQQGSLIQQPMLQGAPMQNQGMLPMFMQMRAQQMQAQQMQAQQMQAQQMQAQQMQAQQMQAQQMQAQQMQVQPRPATPILVPMPAPPFTPDEQALLQQMGSTNSMSNAGPPPFPLSLLPQDSLKQVIGASRSHRSDAPPSYFGCWHQSRPSNLPASGFHPYARGSVQQRSYGNNRYIAHTTGGGPLATRQPYYSHRSTGTSDSTHALGQTRRLQPKEIKVASYAAYPRLSSTPAY